LSHAESEVESESGEGKDRLTMKHLYQIVTCNFNVLRSTSVSLAVLLLLHGCGSVQPEKVEILPTKPDVVAVVISAETRADFDAAMSFINAEENDKGIELLNKVIKESPGNAIPYINLAMAYKKLGKLKLAEDNLKLALNVEPENPVAQQEYALLYRKTGRFVEARKLYESILEKHPNFNMAHKNLGILCDLYMKDYECALKQYVIYSDAMKDDKTVKIWIADLQKRIGK
jgi:tetratricopeptide (TPR) repeat protein